MPRSTATETQQAVDAINAKYPGVGARMFESRDEDGVLISLNSGDAIQISMDFMDAPGGLPDDTYLEAVNPEVLGLYHI